MKLAEALQLRGDLQKRLEQLESLKTAGLITEAEYQEKRREILEEL